MPLAGRKIPDPLLPGPSRLNNPSTVSAVALIFAFWLAIFAAALAAPPLLDDADATHAQAAQAMLHSGDWVTLHVDGVRYLEKPPLPYWIAALSLRVFGETAFAIHLPIGLTVLALALLGYAWSRRAFAAFAWGQRAALYTALFTLTAVGVFLFTRIFIPDALLSLWLALALFAFLRAIDPAESRPNAWAYVFWLALAAAVLTKGLVALVFGLGSVAIFLLWIREPRALRHLRPRSGFLLFLAVAAPWHLLAGLRNRGAGGGHGFFWFYFVNEQFLRFLGRRVPDDYNKLPALLYWSLHAVWLFPWSLFVPAAIVFAWRKHRELAAQRDFSAKGERLSRLELLARRKAPPAATFASRTILLLTIFSALVLVFFAFSTNQEYYTYPAYLPLLMLIAAALAGIEREAPNKLQHRVLSFSYVAFLLIGLAAAAALAYELWISRRLPFQPDIGAALAHRGIGDYTLSMSHFFDLTAASFAGLRLPASLAAIALVIGPVVAWILHTRRKAFAAVLTVALSSATLLIAAHLALLRFAPMLSSQDFAQSILHLENERAIQGDSAVLLYGDQSYGSSIPFYLKRHVDLVDGRTTSMLFGSTFPDAPPIFLTHDQLLAGWGKGSRKLLFVPLEQRAEVDRLLGAKKIVLAETSGKELLTDRPLDPQPVAQTR